MAPLAANESNWMEYIDNYFNSCRIIKLDELNFEDETDETKK